MTHDRITEEHGDQAALFSLGMLNAAQAREFELHLRECSVCQSETAEFHETAAQLPFVLREVQPNPSLRARLLTQVRENQAALVAAPPVTRPALIPDLPAGVHIVLDKSGEWIETPLPGVRYKDLYEDAATHMVTRLVRLDPGAGFRPHRHASSEQCLVMEGDLRFGQKVFHAGDFLCAPAHSIHPESSSFAGCLLLIVTSLHDEVFS